MWDIIVGILRIADDRRKRLKAAILWCVLHFVAIVTAMVYISYKYRIILNPVSAYWGIGLIGLFILIAWTRGGLTLDIVFGTYAGTNIELPRVIARIIIGFVTVESFIVICGCILPLYSSPGGNAFLLISTASYFLYRIMGGLTINWQMWAKVPLLMIGVAVFVLLHDAYFPTLTANNLPSISFKNLMVYGALTGLGLMLVGKLFEDDKTTTVVAAHTKKGDHHV